MGDAEVLRDILSIFRDDKIKCKKLHNNAKLPEKAGKLEACYDFFCVEDDDFVCDHDSNKSFFSLQPQKSHIFHTGIAIQLPKHYGLFLWDRSSMGAKKNIHRLAGVIDPTYTGEILVSLVNLSNETHNIYSGDKIIQGHVAPILTTKIVEVEELEDTYRGDKGFGSTGK